MHEKILQNSQQKTTKSAITLYGQISNRLALPFVNNLCLLKECEKNRSIGGVADIKRLNLRTGL